MFIGETKNDKLQECNIALHIIPFLPIFGDFQWASKTKVALVHDRGERLSHDLLNIRDH